MIIADTNVVSEPLRAGPDARVVGWLRDHAGEIALTSVTVHELLYGVARLPDGRRRSTLMLGVERLIEGAGDRLLTYDREAAQVHASLRVARMAQGRPLAFEDGMIAAIALVHGHVVATRNLRDFDGLGLALIDPWA